MRNAINVGDVILSIETKSKQQNKKRARIYMKTLNLKLTIEINPLCIKLLQSHRINLSLHDLNYKHKL